MKKAFALPVIKITFVYIAASVLWVTFSDRLFTFLPGKGPEMLKDWVFVLGSGLLLFLGLKREMEKKEKAEELLAQERNFIAAVLDTVAALVLVLDREGRIVRFNRACEVVSGFPFREAKGKVFWDLLVPPEEVAGVKEVFARIVGGEKIECFENHWLTASGDKRLISWYINVLGEGHGGPEYVIAAGVDITERRRGEEELQKHRHRLTELVAERTRELTEANLKLQQEVAERQRMEEALEVERKRLFMLLNTLPAFVYLLGPDYRIRFANRCFREWFGGSQERPCYEVLLGGTEPCRDCPPLRVLATGRPEEWEEVVGESIYHCYAYPFVDVGGSPLVLVLGMDITARKKAEEALRESEERYRQLVELSPDAIGVHSDGKIVFVNQAAVRLLGGRSAEELIGRSVMDFVHPDYKELVADRIRKMMTEGVGVPPMEEKLIRDDGTVVDVEVAAAPFNFGGKRAVQIVIRDITERKQLEQEMARLDRLNLIGQMAAGIGHELRNPMTTLRGFLQLLSEREKSDKFREYYEIMIAELDRANAIISEFLALARTKAADLKASNVNNIVRALLPLLQADAMVSGMLIKAEIEEGLPELMLDENEIRQLILNLVRNGLEAMETGGTLTIKTYLDNGYVVLAVQDEGKGIPPEILPKLGTPFFTTKEQGTGLGLAVCYSIAARHNATITVDTSPTGTTFSVRFPLN
ncbi:MAG: two-component system, sporulation sensor kinase [Eubacteriales bacterium]|nr:two-component system, sporulation sensor kinase [Eubacteriales bacterium]